MPDAILVYNPAAGRFPSGILAERAANVLATYGWQIRLKQAASGRHITALARQAAASGMHAFFVAGGDGSVNSAVAGLAGSETALGVLPAGTSNVWAQELGLPGLSWTRLGALQESARRLKDAQVRCVDYGVCNQNPFLLWAGAGLDAFIVNRIEPRRPWEKRLAEVHYAAKIVYNASLWHGMNLRAEVDGRLIEGHFMLALVSNIHLYAGGYATISPYARLDDGVMDLWLFKGENLVDLAQMVWDLLSGAHVHSEKVEWIPFRSLHLESESRLYVQVDGEPVEVKDGATIQVRPQGLRVLIPQNTPHPLFKEDDA